LLVTEALGRNLHTTDRCDADAARTYNNIEQKKTQLNNTKQVQFCKQDSPLARCR
jgi:hypothetical protein